MRWGKQLRERNFNLLNKLFVIQNGVAFVIELGACLANYLFSDDFEYSH